MIHFNVPNAAIEHAGMDQHQSHVAAAFGGDVRRIDVGTSGEVIDGTDHVVGAQADERAPHKIGAQTQEIKRPKKRRLHIVGAGRRWARRDGKNYVAVSRESIEFGSIGCAIAPVP